MPTYESSGIHDEVIESIIDLAKKYGINRVELFGSRARGDFWRASDIDLAVQGGDIRSFCFDVDECTPTLLMYGEEDVLN